LYEIIEKDNYTIRITLHVKPRASRTGFGLTSDQKLKISVQAPPVEGKANKECIKLLSQAFHVPKRDICLIKGQKNRDKTFEIEGITMEQAKSVIKSIL